jgi:glutathione S-transferase
MKLFGSTRSPFVRKVRTVAIALGIDDRLSLEIADPWGDPAFREKNPLSKIPTLETDDGLLLYDSPVICAYLNEMAGGRLMPSAGSLRWMSMRNEALADGICDAAVLRRLELARPDGERSESWADRQALAMKQGCAEMDRQVNTLGDLAVEGEATIGTVAAAVTLAYLDFRWGHEPWRDSNPALATWFARQSETSVMTKLAFTDG